MTDLNLETIVYFTLPENDDTDGDSTQHDQSTKTDWMRIVTIRCYPENDQTPYPHRWVLERAVMPVPSSDVSHVIGDAVDVYVAKKISDPAFAVSSDTWIIRADTGVQFGLHQLVLGDPTKDVCRALDMPGPGADVVGGIAAEITLPIDRPLNFIKLLLQVTGMAVGVLGGFPVLTTACCKSFMHDQLTRTIARGIRVALQDLAATDINQPGPSKPEPAGTSTPGPPVHPPPGQFKGRPVKHRGGHLASAEEKADATDAEVAARIRGRTPGLKPSVRNPQEPSGGGPSIG